MPNLNYNYLTLFIILCLLPTVTRAQEVYEGQVLNSVTEDALVKANVTLLKGKQGTATNQQGYFRLIIDNPIPNDTLIISFVGFKTYRLAVTSYQANMFIKLEPTTNQLDQVNVGSTKVKTKVIEKFSYSDVRDLRGRVYYPTYPFNITGSFAKQFETPVAGTLLTTIHLGRRAAYEIVDDTMDYPRTNSNKLTRFLLHVMSIDTVTGEPAKKLYTKEVTLNDNSLRITFDLTKERIIIKDKKFFVAVEWLLTPINELVKLEIGEKLTAANKNKATAGISRYRILYQPILVILPEWTPYGWRPRLSRVPIWNSRDGVKWTHNELAFDIALSATVTY